MQLDAPQGQDADSRSAVGLVAVTGRGAEGANPRVTSWEDAARVESWAAETRVNLLRAAGVAAFYSHHAFNVYVLKVQWLSGAFNESMTRLALAWVVGIAAHHALLARRKNPMWARVASTIWDLLMTTALLMVAEGPRSPLVVVYLIVIALAGLRLSRMLVWISGVGALAGFMGVVLEAIMRRPALRLPHDVQGVTMVAMMVFTLISLQGVSQARRLIQGSDVDVDPTASSGPADGHSSIRGG